jgi:uncharacterized protein (DUF305 family)
MSSEVPLDDNTKVPIMSVRSRRLLIIVAVMVVFVGGLIVVLNNNASAFGGHPSPEVGFAEDMIVHHAQAVELGQLLYDRTQDAVMRTIALDTMMTQQNQIGQMQGWLYIWGKPIASPELPMTWMDQPTQGLMPGMATKEQIAELRAATGADAERLFMQLMIPHHESAIHMAQVILGETDIPAVRILANSVITTQQLEIDQMKQRLGEMGSPYAESTASP